MIKRYRNILVSWLCTLALMCLVAFTATPRYWWMTTFGLVYACLAVGFLKSRRSRRLMVVGCVFALLCGGVVGGLAAIHGDGESGILMRNAGFLVYLDVVVNLFLVSILWKEEARSDLDRQLATSSGERSK